jgi:hypothetical protein
MDDPEVTDLPQIPLAHANDFPAGQSTSRATSIEKDGPEIVNATFHEWPKGPKKEFQGVTTNTTANCPSQKPAKNLPK